MEKIIQITSGRGPAECCWVVAQVLKQFIEEIKVSSARYEVLQREQGVENGTLRSATLRLTGSGIDKFLKNWIGTIQWVGNSAFRKYHKRKNWFIGLYELESFQHEEISERDIRFQAMRSTGPGGQHVNKVNSAVRATYIPAGISVVAMDSRSQHQNKKLAIQRLKEKILEDQLSKLKQQITDQWENHLQVERGNPIRVFKGTDFKKKKQDKSFKNRRKELKNDLKDQLRN